MIQIIKTEERQYALVNNLCPVQLPKQCPICSGYGAPTLLNKSPIPVLDTSNFMILAEFKCHACDKVFFALYSQELIESNKYFGKLVLTVPGSKKTMLPDFVYTVSPRASKLYEASENAEENSFIDLAGTGYRNSMEILIMDYALTVIGFKRDDLINEKTGKKKLDFFKLVKKVLPNWQIENTVDVVRILGNGFTHFENEYTAEDLQRLKRYYVISLNLLENDYLSRNPEYKREI